MKTLSAAKLLVAIDRQDTVLRKFVDEMIAAGRGHELLSETREAAEKGYDPLALAYCAAMLTSADLEFERKRRLAWHGKLSPIKG